MGRSRIAGIAILIALGWQWATVSLNYGGNWTALFCTGDTKSVPPQLEREHIYRFPGTDGFDGQFYHYIAHQPLPGDMSRYIEASRLRYRRILVPGIAYLAALGQDPFIDFTYRATGFLFLFLGMWWTGACALRAGLSPAWSLLFAALPASVVFVDRLTLDHALAALAAAFVYYAAKGPSARLYAVLLLAPLAREIGLLLIAAYCLHSLATKEWKRALIFGTAALPWFAWTAWLAATIGTDSFPTSMTPLGGLLSWLIHPVAYPADVPFVRLVQLGDALALIGMMLAIVLALWIFARKRTDPVAIAAALFALLTIFLQRDDIWQTVYNYGRIFTPLLLLVALGSLPTRRWLGALPILLLLPRLLMQYGRQLQGVAAALLG